MKEKELDALDRAILGALLEDGRLSQVELAQRIPLSATAIARRIRALEEEGWSVRFAFEWHRRIARWGVAP